MDTAAPHSDDPTEVAPVPLVTGYARALGDPPPPRPLRGQSALVAARNALHRHGGEVTPAFLALATMHLTVLDGLLREAVATGNPTVLGRVDRVVQDALDGLETVRLALATPAA